MLLTLEDILLSIAVIGLLVSLVVIVLHISGTLVRFTEATVKLYNTHVRCVFLPYGKKYLLTVVDTGSTTVKLFVFGNGLSRSQIILRPLQGKIFLVSTLNVTVIYCVDNNCYPCQFTTTQS